MSKKRQDRLYEGWFYHLFVDPALRRVRGLVRDRISPGSTLIDIGCGTGELVFSLADSCSELVGIETSRRMWSYANRRAQALGMDNVGFLFGDGANLESLPAGSFDYATACMVLHEVEQSERLPVLQEMNRVAQTMILVDYGVPQPPNIGARISRLIERLAGRRHYRNYITFVEGGGLSTLLDDLGLSIKEKISFQKECLCLVMAGETH